MHQIRLRLELCPRHRWGAHSAPLGPLAGFKGPTSKERGGRGKGKREGMEGREKENEGEEREGWGRRGGLCHGR